MFTKRRNRYISCLAACLLLALSLCSHSLFKVDAESISGSSLADVKAAMSEAKLVFVGVDASGNKVATDLEEPLYHYNDYSTYTNPNGNAGRWMLADRYLGLATDVYSDAPSGYSAMYTPTATGTFYMVVEWNTITRKFEIIEAINQGERRILNIPSYGFALLYTPTPGNVLTTAQFFSEKMKGVEVRVEMDALITILKSRSTASFPQNVDTYYQFLLRASSTNYSQYLSGERKIQQVDMLFEAVDTYTDHTTGLAANLTGTNITFRVDGMNVPAYNDYSILYDSTYTGALPTSVRGFYVPLKPVAGEPGVYQVDTYTIPKYNSTITAPTMASIPEGGFLLASLHGASSVIKTNSGGTLQRADQRLYLNIGKYFAVGKKFRITDVRSDIEKQIDAIGTVSPESAGAISAARTAYNALSTELKGQVDNIGKLTAAEAKFATFCPSFLGATIRNNGVQGLRYGTQFDTESANGTGYSIVGYGTVLLAKSKWTSGELVRGTTGSVSREGTVLTSGQTSMEYGVTLVNIPVGNYDSDVMARSYVIYRNDTTNKEVLVYNSTGTDNDTSKAFVCNIREIAVTWHITLPGMSS